MPAIALKSDLVVILGDFFATHRFITEHVPHGAWAGELARLKAPLGIYAILGNHDWWYDIEGVRRALKQVASRCWKTTPCCWASRAAASGWPGSATSSPIGSGRAGSAASTTCRARSAKCAATIRSSCWRMSRIFFPTVPERVALTLAGHTHGGQIRLPFVEPFWAPSSYGARYAYGHIVEHGRHMIVSGGLGCSKVPMRLGVPPEVVRVQLGA